MNEFIQKPEDEQRLYFEQASAELNLPAYAIEKDFWVCWTLNKLFSLSEWEDHLTFKGGTSLSKVWKLIDRFSEDIDLVVSRDFLGFSGDKDPESAPTSSQEKKRLKRLKKSCREKVQNELCPALDKLVIKEIPNIKPDSIRFLEDDFDNNTVEFHYPAVFKEESLGAMLPYIKIEMGPRGDDFPAHIHNIKTYLEEALESVAFEPINVQVLDAERTFLEKAMLLHEESSRPEGKTFKGRMARHYYDLYCMIQAGVGDRAIADKQLFKRVVKQRKFYFNVSWVEYDLMRPGSINLMVAESNPQYWKNDYEIMKEAFFFGDAPDFDNMMKVIKEFQQKLNNKNS
jgi:nucleotidyltransferase AbiEii toxin of type IV toxin-antitoxin system